MINIIAYNILYLCGYQNNLACSVHICKQATKTISKEMIYAQINIFHFKNMIPYISMKLQKMYLHL